MGWWSPNPDKAWGERWLLDYSVAWMLAVALVIATGWIHTWGDLGYASYFVVGLPLVAAIDEGELHWSLRRVLLQALATCMLVLCLLEAWTKLVGPL